MGDRRILPAVVLHRRLPLVVAFHVLRHQSVSWIIRPGWCWWQWCCTCYCCCYVVGWTCIVLNPQISVPRQSLLLLFLFAVIVVIASFLSLILLSMLSPIKCWSAIDDWIKFSTFDDLSKKRNHQNDQQFTFPLLGLALPNQLKITTSCLILTRSCRRHQRTGRVLPLEGNCVNPATAATFGQSTLLYSSKEGG